MVDDIEVTTSRRNLDEGAKILAIVREMAQDDRVPVEYVRKFLLALTEEYATEEWDEWCEG